MRPMRQGTGGPVFGPGCGPVSGPSSQVSAAHAMSRKWLGHKALPDVPPMLPQLATSRVRPPRNHPLCIGQGRATPAVGRGLDPAPCWRRAGPAGSLSPGPYTSTVAFPFTDAYGSRRGAISLEVVSPGHWSARRHVRYATCRATAPPAGWPPGWPALAPHLTPTLALVISTHAVKNSLSDNHFGRTRVAL